MKQYFDNNLIEAYYEMCIGITTLRIPEVQEHMISAYPTLGIKSSYTDRKEDLIINVDNVIKAISKEGLIGPPKLRSSFTQVNRIFVIAMWDVLITTNIYSKIATKEIVQFFRHIRNGCAHHNRFHIKDIKYPAKWRDKEITMNLDGNPVFPDFMKDGDVILMLYEINNKFFNDMTT